jgi:hypothetical protein
MVAAVKILRLLVQGFYSYSCSVQSYIQPYLLNLQHCISHNHAN